MSAQRLRPHDPCPCGSGMPFQSCCQSLQATFRKVQKARRDGDHPKALSLIRRARKTQPANPLLFELECSVLMKMERYDECRGLISARLETQPDYTLGHWMIGDCFVRKDDYAAALREYEIARDGLGPEQAGDLSSVLTGMCVCHASLGEFQAALEVLKEALLHDPSNGDAHNLLMELMDNPDVPEDVVEEAEAYCSENFPDWLLGDDPDADDLIEEADEAAQEEDFPRLGAVAERLAHTHPGQDGSLLSRPLAAIAQGDIPEAMSSIASLAQQRLKESDGVADAATAQLLAFFMYFQGMLGVTEAILDMQDAASDNAQPGGPEDGSDDEADDLSDDLADELADEDDDELADEDEGELADEDDDELADEDDDGPSIETFMNIPDAMGAEILKTYYETRWPDEPFAPLNDQTPIEAAKTPAGRACLAASLDAFDKLIFATQEPCQTAVIRRKLGL